MMPESKLRPMRSVIVKETCLGGELQIPADPRVASICQESSPEEVSKGLGTFCKGPAYVYAVLARRILWTSILLLSAAVLLLASCQGGNSGTAKYPWWILVPVFVTASAVLFLEKQALLFSCLPEVLKIQKLTLPLVGCVSYNVWANFRAATTFLQVFSAHTSAFLVAQTLKGIYMCGSNTLTMQWNHLFFDMLPFNGRFFSPAILLLIVWLLGTYSFWRALLQASICPWIQPGQFPGVKKQWRNECPDDICSGPYAKEEIGDGIINYAPKVAFAKGRKLEVRWRSLAYKLQLDDLWMNFGTGLIGQARACCWTAINSVEYDGPLASCRFSVSNKDSNAFWHKSVVNETHYLCTRTLANLLDAIFFKGVLPLIIQVLLFLVDRASVDGEGFKLFGWIYFPSEHNFQLLLSILMTLGTLCLSEALLFCTTMRETYGFLRDVEANVESTRADMKSKGFGQPEFIKIELTDRQKFALKMIKDYDNAWKRFWLVVFWGSVCSSLFVIAVILLVVALW
eukprot:TRINITY_DN5765_c0_g1_i1.p1 TRINITY_DN5765_c0_g1~~TRINITY_DN5765_c0_g1_i1.p1  ORF type:complete len:513 (+),score=33.63 TRINITY_DN5765_c0_g1_i1:141-1679(+)